MKGLYYLSLMGLCLCFNLASLTAQNTKRVRGKKVYELNNHLGNVLATVADRRTGMDDSGDGLVDFFMADLISGQDYYAFGMIMPRRDSSYYRFGFQGQEQDDEVRGKGNSIHYTYRMHNSRLGRFFAVDPLFKSFPYNSNYAFSENRVIDGLELEGVEYYSVHIQRTPDLSIPFNKSLIKIVSHRDAEKGYARKGPGIEYVYHGTNIKGEKYRKSEMKTNLHGIYQGGDNPQKYWEQPDENGEYPYYYKFEPIDEIDAAAKQHDLDYDIEDAKGLSGVLSETTEAADNSYINKANKVIDKYNKGENDAVTGKPVSAETKKAAEIGKTGFKLARFFKSGPKTRQRRMERQLEIEKMGIGQKF